MRPSIRRVNSETMDSDIAAFNFWLNRFFFFSSRFSAGDSDLEFLQILMEIPEIIFMVMYLLIWVRIKTIGLMVN